MDPDAGPIGQAIHVDRDSYVSIPDDAELDIIDEITVAAWVNPEASDRNFATLVGKGATDSYMFGMWGGIADPETTNIRVYISDTGSFGPYIIPMGMDVWSHVAFTFSDDTDRVRMYFNGVKVDSGVNFGVLEDSSSDLTIGDGDYGGYKGKIDEVAIFDRVLTDSEILELYTFY